MKKKKLKELEQEGKLREEELEEFIHLLAENKMAIQQLSESVEKTGKDIDRFLRQYRDQVRPIIII